MKNERPRIRIRPQKWDKVLECAGWVVLAAIWVLVVLTFGNLPDKIPAHYDFLGNVGGWGDKSRIFYLPGLSTLLLIIITYLNFHPHLLNYPVNIDHHNAFKNYFVAVRLNRYVKLLIAIIFFIVTWRTIQIANGHTAKIAFWSLPIIVVVIGFPMATLLIYMFKNEDGAHQNVNR